MCVSLSTVELQFGNVHVCESLCVRGVVFEGCVWWNGKGEGGVSGGLFFSIFCIIMLENWEQLSSISTC